MAYYVCTEHAIAYPHFGRFSFHWSAQHRDVPRPEKADVTFQELPEGITLRQPGSVAKPQPGTGEQPGPSTEEFEIAELPTDPTELFYSILRLKGIPEGKARQLQREFKLSEWMWGDAQEIHTLLKSSKVAPSDEWIRSFLKQYGAHVDLPSKEGTTQFIGPGGSGREQFFNRGTQQAPNPMKEAFDFLDRQQTRMEAARQATWVNPEMDQRLRQVEETNKALLEALRGQEENRKAEALEARLQQMQDLIMKVAEGNQAKGADEGSTWLKAYMDERDKRQEQLLANTTDKYDSVVKGLTDRLADATKALADVTAKIQVAGKQALEEDKTRRAEVRQELEGAGFTSRAKSSEERIMDIAENKILPALASEGKAVRETLTQVATGGRIAPAGGTTPIGDAEAEHMAEMMELEESLKT